MLPGEVPVVVDVLDKGVEQSAVLFADAHARQLHAHMAVQRFRLRALVAQTGQVEPAGIPGDRRRRARIEPLGSRFGIGRSVAVLLVGQLLEREGTVIVVEIEQGVALHQVAHVRVQARDRQRQHLEALDGRGSEMLLVRTETLERASMRTAWLGQSDMQPLAATRFGRFPSTAARFHRRAVLMLSF